MARTSDTILNKIVKSGHPCLFPDLRGNVFSFLLLNMILAHLSSISFIMLIYIPYLPTLWRFYCKWLLNFVKGLFCIY